MLSDDASEGGASDRVRKAGRKIPVTAVVPVKNEERNLPRCLEALARFSEVIVVDSGSTDRTAEISRAASAKFVEFRWDGRFPKKRNWVLLNQKLENDWVLFIDADEVVDDQFCNEVEDRIRSGDCKGYWLVYRNYFLGKPLNHGIPQRKLALFRVGAGLYERIEEDSWSSLDMEVHEHPMIEGAIGQINTPIEHNDFKGIEKFIDRHQDYARWEARRYLLLNSKGTEALSRLTGRQKFKYRNIEKSWYPLLYFFLNYVVKRGFLDGRAGFSYSLYKAWYFQTIQHLITEMRQEAGATK